MHKIKPGVPVRFVATEWADDWKDAHPTILLEPVIRYSPNTDADEVISSATEDIANNLDYNIQPTDDSLPNNLVIGYGKLNRVTEQWVVFCKDTPDGKFYADYVEAPHA